MERTSCFQGKIAIKFMIFYMFPSNSITSNKESRYTQSYPSESIASDIRFNLKTQCQTGGSMLSRGGSCQYLSGGRIFYIGCYWVNNNSKS